MFSVGQILLWSSGKVVNQEEIEALQEKIAVKRMAPLVGASGSDLCFFFSKQYQMELFQTRPGILVTGLSFVQPLRAAKLPLWKTAVVIACEDPYLAMAKISSKFAERAAEEELGSWSDRIHPSASVHPTARLAQGVSIGPNCVVEREVSIGENTKLIAGVFLGSGSSVGRESILFPNVTVYSGVSLVTECVSMQVRSLVLTDSAMPLRKRGVKSFIMKKFIILDGSSLAMMLKLGH